MGKQREATVTPGSMNIASSGAPANVIRGSDLSGGGARAQDGKLPRRCLRGDAACGAGSGER